MKKILLIVFLLISVGNLAFSANEKYLRLHEAAEQGDISAQYNLGGMYRKGQGVTKDFREALTWYRKAAEQGLADAQYSLGWMY